MNHEIIQRKYIFFENGGFIDPEVQSHPRGLYWSIQTEEKPET